MTFYVFTKIIAGVGCLRSTIPHTGRYNELGYSLLFGVSPVLLCHIDRKRRRKKERERKIKKKQRDETRKTTQSVMEKRRGSEEEDTHSSNAVLQHQQQCSDNTNNDEQYISQFTEKRKKREREKERQRGRGGKLISRCRSTAWSPRTPPPHYYMSFSRFSGSYNFSQN